MVSLDNVNCLNTLLGETISANWEFIIIIIIFPLLGLYGFYLRLYVLEKMKRTNAVRRISVKRWIGDQPKAPFIWFDNAHLLNISIILLSIFLIEKRNISGDSPDGTNSSMRQVHLLPTLLRIYVLMGFHRWDLYFCVCAEEQDGALIRNTSCYVGVR